MHRREELNINGDVPMQLQDEADDKTLEEQNVVKSPHRKYLGVSLAMSGYVFFGFATLTAKYIYEVYPESSFYEFYLSRNIMMAITGFIYAAVIKVNVFKMSMMNFIFVSALNIVHLINGLTFYYALMFQKSYVVSQILVMPPIYIVVFELIASCLWIASMSNSSYLLNFIV